MIELRRQLTAVGYIFDLDASALPTIDSLCLRSKMRLRARAPWQDLHQSPRLAPSVGSRSAHTSAGLQDPGHRPITMLPISARIVKSLLRFRTGCHGLPRDVGSMTAVPRCDRICTLCAAGLGDEMHMLFECDHS